MRARTSPLCALWFGFALLGCEARTAPGSDHAKAPQSRLVERVFLDEWLPLEGGRGRCRVTRAEERLTEPSEVPARQVPPDLRALALYTECQGRSGAPLSLEAALPEATLIFLRDQAGNRSAPSVRTKLSMLESAPLVFELNSSIRVLPARRIFDVETGRAAYDAQVRESSLSFEAHGERREIALRHRALDARFDRWLAALVHALDGELEAAEPSPLAPADLSRARASYRALVERFQPTRLAVTGMDLAEDGALRVSLALERPRLHDGPNPVSVLRFLFPRFGAEGLSEATLLEMEDGRAAIDCADQARALRKRAREASTDADGVRCNVLGLSLGERCERLDPALKEQALALQLRCVPGLTAQAHARARRASANRTAPSSAAEFQVTLKRGRRSVGFDHGARYVLSIYGNGSVVFHGKSFVNGTGRSDGRTSPFLIQGAIDRVNELEWFQRRGGEWRSDRCSLAEGRGDVLTVRLHGRERMVLDRDGCRGPFSREELETFRLQLESVAGISGWTQPAPFDADDSAQVSEWTVSADE